ncbi:MAG TPA: hypothetical protein VFP23_00005, partial [Solirubrobacterales bacterium]|nr:hypothetical protein [Solirubrobacterales bacterium]
VAALVFGGLSLDWETPYRVIAKPIETRIHLVKDNDRSAVPAASPKLPTLPRHRPPARRPAARS